LTIVRTSIVLPVKVHVVLKFFSTNT